MELARAGAPDAFQVGNGNSERYAAASGAIVLRSGDSKYSAFHFGFNQRQNVVVGFNLKARGLLTSHFYFKSAARFDRSERRQVSLFSLANARASHSARREDEHTAECESQKNCGLFHGDRLLCFERNE